MNVATPGQPTAQAAARRGLTAENTPALPFLGGAFAASVATVSSYPLDLVRTIMAAQGEPRVYTTMAGALQGQLRARGAAGVFAGLGTTLVEIIPYAGLQFGTYAALKTAIAEHNGGAPVSSGQKFAAGLGAGTAAKLLMHPLDVAKKRFQARSASSWG